MPLAMQLNSYSYQEVKFIFSLLNLGGPCNLPVMQQMRLDARSKPKPQAVLHALLLS